jgi:hypothetical protein
MGAEQKDKSRFRAPSSQAHIRALAWGMFTIEHEFDATVVTLVDEGPQPPLQEDITINAFEDCVTLEQYDPRTDTVNKITFSLDQLDELAAALDLPEGVYRLYNDDGKD